MNYLYGQNLRASTRRNRVPIQNIHHESIIILNKNRFRSSTYNPSIPISYNPEFQTGINPNEELHKIMDPIIT